MKNYPVIKILAIGMMWVLASCSKSVKPFDPVEQATLDCIRSASWEITSSKKQNTVEIADDLKRIQVVNTGDVPVCFEFYPWWDADSLAIVQVRAVDPKDLPETCLAPGESKVIRIIHPVFFREGGVFTTTRKMNPEEIAKSSEAQGIVEMGLMPFSDAHVSRVMSEQLQGHGIYTVELK